MAYSMLQIKKETHTILKTYCEENGFKMGSLVEKLIRKHINSEKQKSVKPDYIVRTKNQSY
jgi:hypothetical protein